MWFIPSNNNNNNNNKIEENIIKTTNNNNSISKNHSHNMEILIDYSDQNKTIIDILNAIAIKYKIRISLFIETEYKIAAVNFHKKSLKSILEDFQKIYDLHYRMEKDVIYIEECENKWQQYYVNNFHEENLPKDLDSIANIDNSTEKSKQVIYKPFWDQVELTIKKLTNDQYIIDKHNCIVHILGKCKTQALVKEYIDKISTLQQVEIEIKFLEITSDYNVNINPMEIIEPLLKYNNNSNSKGFSTLIGSFSNIIMSTYKNITINYSSTMKLRLLSQHTGQISVTNEINEFRVGKVKNFNLKDNNKNLIREAETLYQFTEGLSLTFVPVILENNKILLKMRPSIKKYKKNTDNEINMGNREIMTVLYGQCNELLAVGGLETTSILQSESLFQKIPLLGRLIPKKTKKEKTQIIILLKMNIVK